MRDYRSPFRQARIIYDSTAVIFGAKPLPGAGEPVSCAYASFVCVANNDPAIFRVLLEQARALAAERGHSYLMIGLSQADPLLQVMRRYIHIPYRSQAYTISFQQSSRFAELLDSRVPYLELAAV